MRNSEESSHFVPFLRCSFNAASRAFLKDSSESIRSVVLASNLYPMAVKIEGKWSTRLNRRTVGPLIWLYPDVEQQRGEIANQLGVTAAAKAGPSCSESGSSFDFATVFVSKVIKSKHPCISLLSFETNVAALLQAYEL